MTMKISVRKMLPEDVNGVYETEKSCFGAEAWSINDFKEIASDESGVFAALCAVSEGGIIGYICGNCVMGELEIGSVAVKKEFRRLGAAKALISALEEIFSPEKAFLEVRESNIAAQRLYESLGFYKVYVRKDYYSSPVEDAIIMKKVYGSAPF